MNLKWNTPKRLQDLLCRLAGWDSVTGTAGERTFAQYLASELRDITQVRLGEVDSERNYVTALHQRPRIRDTIVLISHFDTPEFRSS